MFAFILDTLLVLLSSYLIFRTYRFTKNEENDIEARIEKYIFGSIYLLGIGIFLAAISIIASRKLDTNIEPLWIAISSFIALLTYVFLIYLWNKMYSFIKTNLSKRIPMNHAFKLKSISIYGLVYSFGILFYLFYLIVLFF